MFSTIQVPDAIHRLTVKIYLDQMRGPTWENDYNSQRPVVLPIIIAIMTSEPDLFRIFCDQKYLFLNCKCSESVFLWMQILSDNMDTDFKYNNSTIYIIEIVEWLIRMGDMFIFKKMDLLKTIKIINILIKKLTTDLNSERGRDYRIHSVTKITFILSTIIPLIFVCFTVLLRPNNNNPNPNNDNNVSMLLFTNIFTFFLYTICFNSTSVPDENDVLFFPHSSIPSIEMLINDVFYLIEENKYIIKLKTAQLALVLKSISRLIIFIFNLSDINLQFSSDNVPKILNGFDFTNLSLTLSQSNSLMFNFLCMLDNVFQTTFCLSPIIYSYRKFYQSFNNVSEHLLYLINILMALRCIEFWNITSELCELIVADTFIKLFYTNEYSSNEEIKRSFAILIYLVHHASDRHIQLQTCIDSFMNDYVIDRIIVFSKGFIGSSYIFRFVMEWLNNDIPKVCYNDDKGLKRFGKILKFVNLTILNRSYLINGTKDSSAHNLIVRLFDKFYGRNINGWLLFFAPYVNAVSLIGSSYECEIVTLINSLSGFDKNMFGMGTLFIRGFVKWIVTFCSELIIDEQNNNENLILKFNNLLGRLQGVNNKIDINVIKKIMRIMRMRK